MIQLIAGLGNPGPEYLATRHNAGFWWLENLAQQWGVQLAHSRDFHGFIASSQQQGRKVWLLQPTLFMNRSGQSVAALARFYKILPENILVVHDELDLEPGQARLKQGGGHAGHNGLRSIKAHLHSDDFVRVRIGVGKPPSKERGADHVLKRVPKAERVELDIAVQQAADAVEAILDEGVAAAMNRFNALD